MLSNVENLKPSVSEMKTLAGPVLAYLAAFTENAARTLEERIEKLQKSLEL